MMRHNTDHRAFQNVTHYPAALLRQDHDGVQIALTYKRVWDDGFGARGWKVDATIGDPEIIASTRETGQQIKTSVFVHDILDHFLSGFGVSGHRSEAMALIQLSKRTGSTPSADYEQLVREDILNGRVNGDRLIDFLPAGLRSLLTDRASLTDRETMVFLREQLGEKRLVEILVERFYQLGRAGETHADKRWEQLGLETKKRNAIGLALQVLLEVIDRSVEEAGIEELQGEITINNDFAAFMVSDANVIESIDRYRVEVSTRLTTTNRYHTYTETNTMALQSETIPSIQSERSLLVI